MEASQSDDVVVTGERTQEQRNEEGRKNAIDLEASLGKRGREELSRVDERVVLARSVFTAAVDQRMRQLIEPDVGRFLREEIDADALTDVRKAARQQAESENAELSVLNKAYANYTAAVMACEEAGRALEAVLQPLEGRAAARPAKKAKGGEGAGESSVKAEAGVRGEVASDSDVDAVSSTSDEGSAGKGEGKGFGKGFGKGLGKGKGKGIGRATIIVDPSGVAHRIPRAGSVAYPGDEPDE